MPEKHDKITSVDVPDPGKLEEHGVSIDAPTPTQFLIPNPWAPSDNGAAQGSPDPAPTDSPSDNGPSSD